MKVHLSLFKFTLALSFPIAGIVHHLMPIIMWFRNQDLLMTFLALSMYYGGFFAGNQYVIRSRTSLSRIIGMMFAAHVITALIFATYGYGVLLPISSFIVGMTIGGLLSLPSYMVLKPLIASMMSFVPLLSAFIIFVYGVDEVLLISALSAFILSILQLLSLKIIVMKPKLIEKTDLPLTLEGLILAFGIGTCGSILSVFSQLVVVTNFNIEVIYVGVVVTTSLFVIQMIGWVIGKQDKIHKGLGGFIALSLFLSTFFMSIVIDSLAFLFLWTLALIDISAYNSFISIVNRSLKKFDYYKFVTSASAFSTIGPMISFGLWTLIDYRSVYYLASLLVLISWLCLRRLLRAVK